MGKPTYFRIEKLLGALEGLRGGLTLEGMAEELEVSRRTVQRYVQDLLTEGWIQECNPDEYGRKRWRLAAKAQKRIPLDASLSEMLALRVALQATVPLVAGTELEDSLRSVLGAVKKALPKNSQFFARMADLAFPELARPGRASAAAPEVVEDILEAVVKRRILKAEYGAVLHGGEVKSYVLKPLTVFPYKGALYLGALTGDSTTARRFRLDRFVSVELTREKFEPPEEFSPEEFVHRPFGVFDDEPFDVRVRFSSVVAGGVRERIWHESQVVADLPGGGVEIAFRASGWPEIRAWVLGYGGYAELVEPAARRAEIASELRSTLGKYEPPPTPAS